MSLRCRRRLGVVVVLLASVSASACSTQARWVDCERRLEPINPPAPKAQREVPPAAPTRATEERAAS